jgi:RNA polymerase sigma-70 factor (ECF subfamily)
MDDELDAIMKLKRGDINGLEYLVKKYQVKAVRAAYLITRDQNLAEDIVQAAFLRVFERINQFDTNRPFSPWFQKIVTNAALKAAKRQHLWVSLDPFIRRGKNYETDFNPNSRHGLEDLILRNAAHQELRGVLARLSPSQRTILVLRYYLGLKEKDIADSLNSPLDTVKWRIHAARQRMRALLRADGELTEGKEGSQNG